MYGMAVASRGFPPVLGVLKQFKRKLETTRKGKAHPSVRGHVMIFITSLTHGPCKSFMASLLLSLILVIIGTQFNAGTVSVGTNTIAVTGISIPREVDISATSHEPTTTTDSGAKCSC